MLTLEEKIGQMMMVGFHGLEPPDHILEWLAEGKISGVILFTRNIASPSQLASLTNACHAAAKRPILVAIDQEGGSVSRLRDQFTESPGAMALGASGSETIAEAISEVLGNELRSLGINWNYAPNLDITYDINNPSIGTRSISDDKNLVSRIGVAEVRGFQKSLAACIKHFPGSGNTPTDTHLATARITESGEYLWDNNLIPFRAAVEAGVASVMVSHVTFDALDPDHPGTLSYAVATDLLRNRMDYRGVIVTDCMEMKAITDNFGRGEAAVLAVLAGHDMVLISHTKSHQEEAYEMLLNAARSGRISIEQIDASVERIQELKARFTVTTSADSTSIMNESHLKVAEAAAQASTVLLRTEDDVLPLYSHNGRKIVALEFSSYAESIAVEKGGNVGFESLLRQRLPDMKGLVLRSEDVNEDTIAQARAMIQQGDILVLATRSAHLIPDQQELAREFLSLAKQSILVCLRNPYDASVLLQAGTVLCTCGDSAPSIQAAVDALCGEFMPMAHLPVSLV